MTVYSDTDLKCDAYVFVNYINIQPFKNKRINYERCFTLGGINFEFVDGYSLLAEYNGNTVGICAGHYIPFYYCDYLFSDSHDECDAKIKVSFNERNFDNCIYNDGDLGFRLK